MRRKDTPLAAQDSLTKHARLFELIRQQNLIASSRVGRKQRSLDDETEIAILTAASASLFEGAGGYL